MEAKDPQRLVIAVGDALPRLQGALGDRSDLEVRLDFGEQVVAAAKGGVEAAAQAAYRAGFRAGERYGQRLVGPLGHHQPASSFCCFATPRAGGSQVTLTKRRGTVMTHRRSSDVSAPGTVFVRPATLGVNHQTGAAQ